MEKGANNKRTLRQAYAQGDGHDWPTGVGAHAVQVPRLIAANGVELQGKLSLDSGATISMGGVDLPTEIQSYYMTSGLRLISREAPSQRFSFASG